MYPLSLFMALRSFLIQAKLQVLVLTIGKSTFSELGAFHTR
jgi:hypothetical protein